MKMRNLIVCFLLGLLSVSCIQDEALNAEADILTCKVSGDILKTEPEIDNESVTLTVKSGVDIKHLAPEFTITPGATIVPASGTVADFTIPQQYTVTSEDGKWSKTYVVRCLVSGISTDYHFEHVTMEPKYGRYQIFYDYLANGDSVVWASGNGGFSLTGVAKDPLDFPTMQDENGYKGKCAKLVTRSTGSFGAGFGMPIASGNLFIGTFDLLSAIPDARKATRLGRVFDHVPTSISGYYKYKAGPKYMRDGKEIAGMKDQCDIYAIFFETDENVKYLDGFNGLTSPNLISVARVSGLQETDEWTHFYIPFVAKPGKLIDKEKLANGGYKLAMVFASSLKGDVFEGAEESTLWIDEIEIAHADNN